VVYDNASTDATCDVIRSSYPEVKLIAGDENLGFSAANNQAAGCIGATFCLFNPDTFVDPDWLSPLITP